jgi:hypothetical protein
MDQPWQRRKMKKILDAMVGSSRPGDVEMIADGKKSQR